MRQELDAGDEAAQKLLAAIAQHRSDKKAACDAARAAAAAAAAAKAVAVAVPADMEVEPGAAAEARTRGGRTDIAEDDESAAKRARQAAAQV